MIATDKIYTEADKKTLKYNESIYQEKALRFREAYEKGSKETDLDHKNKRDTCTFYTIVQKG